MSCAVYAENGVFLLSTAHTSYFFKVAESGHLQHLYYGARLAPAPGLADALTPKAPCLPGSSIQYSPKYPALSLDRLCGEVSSEGKGDFGEPMVCLSRADGTRTADFVYETFSLPAVKTAPAGLPGAYDADGVLVLTMHDADVPALKLELTYAVFADTDCITRSACLINGTDTPLTLEKLASAQIDFPDDDFVFTAFHGSWADEMHRADSRLNGNTAVCESRCGSSSNRANPLTLLSRPGATETAGEVYAMNLLYSGNHRTAAQPGACGRLRWQCGIQPEGFSWALAPGESFASPEAVFSYAENGFGAVSRQMQRFVRRHIVRGTWRDKPRPVLLNSWEACYFHFTEAKLLKLAKAGAAAGIELFVLDDGWFGHRNDDHSSLGDWNVNLKKLPHGLKGLADKVNALGMAFGIWVEPEMISVDSDLYRNHPDWAMAAPGRAHSEGRNQRILDLANPDVRDYLKASLETLLSGANIAYVKWDMNRLFSDAFSPYLGNARQGETAHRYLLGLYDIVEYLVKKFPNVLFESCSSGGNRGDLGLLCYMPQFWASDNTDAVCRASIQTGYSYGYPLSALGCHVSACPNHQTLRVTSLDTRFAVAACGVLGYEMDFTELSPADLREIAAQIKAYKAMRPWLQSADYYRIENGTNAGGTLHENASGAIPRYRWAAVSPDKMHALAGELQLIHTLGCRAEYIRIPGLVPDAQYHFHKEAVPVDIRPFGSLVNQISPVHLKQGGVLHTAAAALVHLPGDSEDATLSGAALAACGAAVCQPFCGTGYAEGISYLPDFTARLYYADRVVPALPAADVHPGE